MATNSVQEYEVTLITYKEVKESHPQWTDEAIEDYMARYRDFIFLTEKSDEDTDRITVNEGDIKNLFNLYAQAHAENSKLRAELNKNRKQLSNHSQLIAGV